MPGLTWPWRICLIGLPLLVLAVAPARAAPAAEGAPQRLEPAPDPELDALLGPSGAAGAARSATRRGNGEGDQGGEGNDGGDDALEADLDPGDGAESGDAWLFDGESDAPKPRSSEDDGPAPSPFLNRLYQNPLTAGGTPPHQGARDELFRRRFQIIHGADLQEGMRIAVVGSDGGLLAAHLARAVGPEGLIQVLDPDPESAPVIAQRARDYRVENLRHQVLDGEMTGLEPGSIDLAVLQDSYHRLADPAGMLAALSLALGDFGQLLLLEPRYSPALALAGGGKGPDELAAEISAAGFRLVDEPLVLSDYHYLRFATLGTTPSMEVGPIETLPEP